MYNTWMRTVKELMAELLEFDPACEVRCEHECLNSDIAPIVAIHDVIFQKRENRVVITTEQSE